MRENASPVGRWIPWFDRRFLFFATGNSINNIGESFFSIALPLLAYELTESLLVMSLLAALIPATLVLSPALGVAVDRYGPSSLILAGLVVQLAAAVALNLLALGQSASIGLIFLFAAIVQIGGSAYRAGWMAGVATLFPADPIRARGSLGALYVTTGIVGAGLVGVLLPLFGYEALLWINALTFVAPLVVQCAGIKPATGGDKNNRGSVNKQFSEGFQALKEQPDLMTGFAAVTPLLFVGSSGTLTLLTFYLLDDFDTSPERLGYILAAVRVGSLAGTLLVSEARQFKPRRILVMTSVTMFLSLVGVSLLPEWGVIGSMMVFFVATASMSVMADLLVFEYIKPELLGRASGLLNVVEGLPGLVAPLLIPVVATLLGNKVTFSLLALLCLATPLILSRSGAPKQHTLNDQ